LSKQIEMASTFENVNRNLAFEKIMRCIESSVTDKHQMTIYKMIENFKLRFKDDKNIYEQWRLNNMVETLKWCNSRFIGWKSFNKIKI
jgi:hypothetical protein